MVKEFNLVTLKISSENLDQVERDLVLVTVFEDERPLKGLAGFLDWRLCGALSQLMLDHHFDGKKGESLLMPSQGRVSPKEILVLGLGQKENLKTESLPQQVQVLLTKLLAKKSTSFCLSLSHLSEKSFDWRNSVRLLASSLSGRKEDYQITLLEPENYVQDARARHMDFAYDVEVKYE